MRNLTIIIVLALVAAINAGAADLAALEVTIVKDVAYLGPKRAPKLDLYLPEPTKEISTFPAILIVHGGGWHTGDKAAARETNIATNLAAAGYVCASANYVLAKKKEAFTDNLEQVWPRNLQDCMEAVRFLRKNAREYHINPERIGAIGGSAGGHLVAMLATAGDRDGLDPESVGLPISCRIQAAVPMYGVHDLRQWAKDLDLAESLSAEDKDLCRRASPVTYLSRDDPPLLILHGTADPLVPVEQSKILHRAARKAGIDSDLHIIKGAKHSFHLQPAQQDLRPIVIDFFDKHLEAAP